MHWYQCRHATFYIRFWCMLNVHSHIKSVWHFYHSSTYSALFPIRGIMTYSIGNWKASNCLILHYKSFVQKWKWLLFNIFAPGTRRLTGWVVWRFVLPSQRVEFESSRSCTEKLPMGEASKLFISLKLKCLSLDTFSRHR